LERWPDITINMKLIKSQTYHFVGLCYMGECWWLWRLV